MKKLITILAFASMVLMGATVQAQSSNGNGNGGSNNPNVHQQMPMSLVVDILRAAQPYFGQQMGLSLGQLIQKYRRCECTITLSGDGKYYLVTVLGDGGGGGSTVVLLDEI